MSDAVVVTLVIAVVANFVLVLKLVFTAGGMKRSLDTLVEAKVPERLIAVETKEGHLEKAVEDLKEIVEGLRDLTPPPRVVAHRR